MARKVNQIRMGVVLSYMQMIARILVGLIYTPIMLRLLGQSEYGLYNTTASTISTLYLLSFGFGDAYIRYYSEYRHKKEKKEIFRLNGTFMIIFILIGLLAFACGIYLTNHLELIFDQGFTVQEYEKARILMFILTINVSLSFPMSVFTTIIGANERFVFQKLIATIQTVLSPCLTLPLLMMGYGAVGLTTLSLALAIISWGINIYYCWTKLGTRFIFSNPNLSLLKNLFVFSFFIALNSIVDQINWNIDKLLLGRFKGTATVAVYSLGYNLYSYYQNFSTSISGVFTPRIHKIVQETRKDTVLQKAELTGLFVKVGRIQFLALALIASGIAFFGKEFIINVWAGAGYEDSYYVSLLLILPASIALIQNLGIEIQRALDKHQFRSIVYTFMAGLNLAISIILCQKLGAIGSALGTAFSLIFANGLIMNLYYHKRCNLDMIQFWREIRRLSLGLLPSVIVGVLIKNLIPYTNFVVFALRVLLYTVTYCVSMYMMGMNAYEKQLVNRTVQKIVNGIKYKTGGR